jgi:2,3-bisphosphoglycerate-independent phosphoglycerate mutase
MSKKIVFLIIDGLPDSPVKNKTPLSSARMPNVHWLASHGAVGEMIVLPEKM